MARRTGFSEYGSCYVSNPVWAIMWLAECAKQCGNWFTFVAAYAVIAELSGADSMATHTALFLICRRLPYLVLFPLTGAAADRFNRGTLLVLACLLQGTVSFLLPLVRARQQIELLYPLILIQYSAQALYDPARVATVPTVVPPAHICVASTLDTFGFSFSALIGATMAGRTAALYGSAVCFQVEGVAFAIAATLLLRLMFHIGQQRAREQPKALAAHAGAAQRRAAQLAPPTEDAPPELQPLLQPPPLEASGHGGGGGGGDADDDADGGDCGSCACCGALTFLAQRKNWDVLVLIFAKATGATVWGAADVLNGRFVNMPSMQSLGGPDQTLGYVLAAVGLGCVVGPIAANAVTPGAARYYRVSIAVMFIMLLAGYTLMATAKNIWYILPSTAIRAGGGNTLWIHSLSILQHRLPEGVRGRVFAVEYVLYTLSESASTLFGGFALDPPGHGGLGWSTTHLCAALATLAAVYACFWSLHAWVLWGSRGDYHDGGASGPPLAAAANGGRRSSGGGSAGGEHC